MTCSLDLVIRYYVLIALKKRGKWITHSSSIFTTFVLQYGVTTEERGGDTHSVFIFSISRVNPYIIVLGTKYRQVVINLLLH